jgi:hypothetical protein
MMSFPSATGGGKEPRAGEKTFQTCNAGICGSNVNRKVFSSLQCAVQPLFVEMTLFFKNLDSFLKFKAVFSFIYFLNYNGISIYISTR